MRLMTVGLSVFALSAMCSIAAAQDDTLRPCAYRSQLYRTLKVVIRMRPAAALEWKFPEAPQLAARWLLDDLNKNANWRDKDELIEKDFPGFTVKSYIKFEEANGQEPNFIIDVTATETHAGTRQASLEAVVEGERNPDWWAFSNNPNRLKAWRERVSQFTVKSGDFPFTNMSDAVDALSKNVANWLRNGWGFKPPCWDFDKDKGWFVRRK